MKTVKTTPKIITSSKKIDNQSKELKDLEIKYQELTFKKLSTFQIPAMLQFITAIYKKITEMSKTREGIYDESVKFEIENIYYTIDIDELIFNEYDLENFLEFLATKPDEDTLKYHLNRISISSLPYTCGITEIGNIESLTAKNLSEKFLTIALYVKSFYELSENQSGMVQLTLVNTAHEKLISLIIEYLFPSTILTWTNPRSDNKLTTFIWV